MFNLKKSIISAVIYYAIIFLAVSLLMFGPVKLEGITLNITTWIISAISIYLLGTKYYFKTKSFSPFKDGLYFGLAVLIVAIIIEIPVMVYGFAADQGWAWFTQPKMIISYLLILVVAIYTAYRK